MDFEEAILHAKAGNAVAFLGAGFSVGAISLAGEPVPTGKQLSDKLTRDLGLSGNIDLQNIAQIYEDERGADSLQEILLSSFQLARVEEQHRSIARVPFRRVYTTNFDNAYELASQDIFKRVNVATVNTSPDKMPKNVTSVVHLHGSVLSLTGSSATSLQLTLASYLSSQFPASPWVPVFRNDVRFAQSIILFGYSLNDLDISRIIFDEEISKKTFIIIHPDTSELEKRRIAKFGFPVPMDIVSLGRLIDETEYVAIGKPIDTIINFSRITQPDDPTLAGQDDYVALLTKGVFQPEMYAAQLAANIPTYATPRPQLALFRNLEINTFVVHSNLGNGKSVFLSQVALEFIERGFDVYKFERMSDNFSSDVDTILGVGRKTCIIVDGITRFRDAVTYIASRMGPGDLLIVSCRTITLEIERDEILTSLGGNFLEVDLNLLTTPEIQHFAEVFSGYGLWGVDARLSPPKQIEKLKTESSGEMRSVVLFAFERGVIADKLNAWAQELQSATNDIRQTVLAVTLNALVHADLTLIDLCEIMRLRYAVVRREIASGSAAEIVSVGGIYADIKSAILAEHIAKTCFEPEFLLDTLTKLVRSLSEWSRSGEQYRDFLRELMRFAVLGRLFIGDSRRDYIIRYYEGVRNIEFCRTNPAFWLQYAMARLDREEYALAQRLLETAEGHARSRPGYNLFQINNQKAKFLLLSRARTDLFSDFVPSYVAAAKIILTQIQEAKGKRDPYPLRLIPSHEEFIAKRASALDAPTRKLALRVIEKFDGHLDGATLQGWMREELDWKDALARTRLLLE